MTDEMLDPRFENDLRNALRAQAPKDVPQSLRSFVATLPQRDRPARVVHPIFTRFAAFATAAVVIVAAVGTVLVLSQNTPTPPIGGATFTPQSSSPAATLTPEPSSTSATVTPQPSPSAEASIVTGRYQLQVSSGDHALTTAEQESIAASLFGRLEVYDAGAISSDVAFTDPAHGVVTVTLRGETEYPGLTTTLAAPGELALVPFTSDQAPQPGDTLDPGLPVLFSNSGHDFEGASFWPDQDTGERHVEIDFGPAASQTLSTWSAAHVGDALAIVIDGTVVAVPIVLSPLRDGTMAVVFSESQTEIAQRIAALVTSGPLPYPLTLVSGPKGSLSPGS